MQQKRIVTLRSSGAGHPEAFELTFAGPLGGTATASLSITNSRDELARIRCDVSEVRRADIVVAAVGVPHLVKADWVKPGVAVLDVGVTRVGIASNGRAKLAGDVDPEVAEVAGFLSPNPGGVGPMTRAILLQNVVEAAERL